MIGCNKPGPNIQVDKVLKEQQTQIDSDASMSRPYGNEVYVPVYTFLYNDFKETQVLFTVTLSVRNTSTTDSLFLEFVDYYDTAGNLVHRYLEEPIYLNPVQTVEYAVERSETAGGSGANFVLHWSANADIKPIFQAVMVGVDGNQGFAFKTEGVPTGN